MSIIIIGDSFTFPDGNAATNRVHTYAKGFSENGIYVHVICFASRYNTPGDGITDGVKYYHPFGQSKRSRYFIIRQWQKIIKHFKTFFIIRKINKQDKVLALICYTPFIQTLFFVYAISKWIKSKVLLERSEHPLRKYQKSNFTNNIGNFKASLETKLCDGIFCISEYLINFYKCRQVKIEKLFLVPSTVEPDRFNDNYQRPLPYKYILYCGTLTLKKDGVDILIKSFAQISEEHFDLNLVLIGKSNSPNEEIILKQLVSKLKMDKRIFFAGQIPRTEIAAYMKNALILTLARPTSMTADAGFPSKLTEYLATGIPVVVTEVGEIPVYLKDRENAFISKPDSVEAFAGNLKYVLANYKFAKGVAKTGKELTNTIFNYNFQAKRMIEFIKTLHYSSVDKNN